jgi:hypothetical protein
MSKLNPQKASAYVGPGVLRKGGKITPVPNGPLIKKTGQFKGSTLKAGGTIKKAMVGTGIFKNNPITKKANAVRGLVGKAYGLPGKVIVKNGGSVKETDNGDPPKPNYSNMKTTKRSFFEDKPYTPTAKDSLYYRQGFDMALKGKSSIPAYDMKTNQGLRGYEEATKRGLNPKKKPRAKAGAMIKRAQNGDTTTVKKPKVDGFFKNIDKKLIKKSDTTEFYKGRKSKIMDDGFFKGPKVKSTGLKNGGMIKRADGSYSQRGLWDNIRANKGSGKKPTKQMLVQEKKIKAKSKK